MKIRLWSDVHNEFGPIPWTKTPDDTSTVLVIAGDFQVGVSHLALLEELCDAFRDVVYLPGNHEYYHQNLQETDCAYRKFASRMSNLHFLNPGQVILPDFGDNPLATFGNTKQVRFLGGTFWTDMKNGDPLIMNLVRNSMNDFRCIKFDDRDTEWGERVFTPADAREINRQHREFFFEKLNEPFEGKTVIVTHHAPHDLSIDEKFKSYSRDAALNFGYHNTGLEPWFEKLNFHYWFHGHIHNWKDYELFDKRVIARPRGYHNHEIVADQYDLAHKDAMILEI